MPLLFCLSTTAYNATLSNNSVITVIHPFLPNKGKTYTCLKKVRYNGNCYLKCLDESNQLIKILVEYTNYNENEISKLHEIECDFSFKDLVKLYELVELIKNNVY
jgi:hypothetical protein